MNNPDTAPCVHSETWRLMALAALDQLHAAQADLVRKAEEIARLRDELQERMGVSHAR